MEQLQWSLEKYASPQNPFGFIKPSFLNPDPQIDNGYDQGARISTKVSTTCWEDEYTQTITAFRLTRTDDNTRKKISRVIAKEFDYTLSLPKELIADYPYNSIDIFRKEAGSLQSLTLKADTRAVNRYRDQSLKFYEDLLGRMSERGKKPKDIKAETERHYLEALEMPNPSLSTKMAIKLLKGSDNLTFIAEYISSSPEETSLQKLAGLSVRTDTGSVNLHFVFTEKEGGRRKWSVFWGNPRYTFSGHEIPLIENGAEYKKSGFNSTLKDLSCTIKKVSSLSEVAIMATETKEHCLMQSIWGPEPLLLKIGGLPPSLPGRQALLVFPAKVNNKELHEIGGTPQLTGWEEALDQYAFQATLI